MFEMWTSLKNMNIACEIVDVVCTKCTLCVCERTFIAIYISRTYFSHTFSCLLIFTRYFQVAGCISGMAIVTIRIDENSIINRQGIPVSQADLITFLFGMIDNSLQVLQRENKSSVCGIKILFQYSVESLFSTVIYN